MRSYLDSLKEENMSLFTDLYELTMCASYFDNDKFQPATFDLFVRRLPENRGYLLFAGLEQVLDFLESVRFTDKHLAYLRKQGFDNDFLDYLSSFRFTGEVWAMPEGTTAFSHEPLIRVTAPIIEAQLIETFLLNTVNLQTMIATKVSRVVHSAEGRPIIEFGLRREHGIDAGIKVARCSYIAGCMGTSNVLAGFEYGIPVFGTMAHSFIMSFEKEIEAFRAFAKTFPNKSILLIDTYNDMAAAEKAALIAKDLEAKGCKLDGVRIDSGDIAETSKKVRALLDSKGLDYVKIFASGDLDEYRIEELSVKGARIDSFGVGTRMGTSEDKPYLDVIYKISETLNENDKFLPIMKLSEGKNTLPGRKQVFRFKNKQGDYTKDVIALADEKVNGEPLLTKVMAKGIRICDSPTLENIRKFASENLSFLPAKYRQTTNPPIYPVELSDALKALVTKLKRQITRKEIESARH
jgi:nicotinate phosphoribosyltransferase